MKLSRFTEEQIIRVLKEAETGEARLRQMVANQALDLEALRTVLGKK